MKIGLIVIFVVLVVTEARTKRSKRQFVATIDGFIRSARPAADRAYDWASGKAKEAEPVVRSKAKQYAPVVRDKLSSIGKRLSKRDQDAKVVGTDVKIDKLEMSKKLPTILRLILGFYQKNQDNPLILGLADSVYKVANNYESMRSSGNDPNAAGFKKFEDDAQTLETIEHIVSRLSGFLKQTRNNNLVKTLLLFAEAVIGTSDAKSLPSKNNLD